MSNFRKIQMFFNEKGEQVDASGKNVKNSDIIRLIYDETVVICACFLHVSSVDSLPETEPVELDPAAAFSCFGDTGFQSENLIFIAQNNPADPQNQCVNLPGDWIDGNSANPQNGELSFRISTSNINFSDALSGKQSRTCQMVITAAPPGSTECSVLALCPFTAYNRPSLQDFPPENISRNFLDAAQIAALFAAEVQMQFTPDPESGNVSSQRRAGDNFIRFRNTAVKNAAWSAWVEIVNGMSAYECWLAQGNTGNTDDFLKAIKGEPAQPTNDVMIDTGALDNMTFSATPEQLGVQGCPAVQLFDADGVAASANQNIRIQWLDERLSIDFSSMETPPQGVWTLKFAGGAALANMIIPADAVPVFFHSQYGFYYKLDQNTPVVYITTFAENIIRVKFYLAAYDDSVNNISIQISCRGSVIQSAEIPVSTTPAIAAVSLPNAVSGSLSIQRTTETDDGTGAVIIYGIILEAKP